MNRYQRVAEYLSKFPLRNATFKNQLYGISAKPLDDSCIKHSNIITDKTFDNASEHEALRKQLVIADEVAEAVDPLIADYLVYGCTTMDEQKYSFLRLHGLPDIPIERFIEGCIMFYLTLADALENS